LRDRGPACIAYPVGLASPWEHDLAIKMIGVITAVTVQIAKITFVL